MKSKYNEKSIHIWFNFIWIYTNNFIQQIKYILAIQSNCYLVPRRSLCYCDIIFKMMDFLKIRKLPHMVKASEFYKIWKFTLKKTSKWILMHIQNHSVMIKIRKLSLMKHCYFIYLIYFKIWFCHLSHKYPLLGPGSKPGFHVAFS